jgi:hypothetical protein
MFDVLAKKAGEIRLVESLILRGNRPLCEEFCPNLLAEGIIDKDGDATDKDLIGEVSLKSEYDFQVSLYSTKLAI